MNLPAKGSKQGRTRETSLVRFRWNTPTKKRGIQPMSQYQKFAMVLGLGLMGISMGTGCATTVEEPIDEQAMTADETAESSDALTTGDNRGGFGRGRVGRGGFRNFGPGRGLALGRRFGHAGRGHFHGGYGYGAPIGHFVDEHEEYGYGGYGYGGYGYGGYGGYGQDINIYVEQNNGPDYGDDYDDYEDFEDDYDDGCDAYDDYP